MDIALLGLGTVGRGAMDMLTHHPDIHVKRALVRRIRPELGALTTTSFDDILSDDSISTIVEVMGGTEPAHSYVLQALRAGKHVVTPNRRMLAGNLSELMDAAREGGSSLRFASSVGGSIPWLVHLAHAGQIDRVTSIFGLPSATVNHFIDDMASRGVTLSQAVETAQESGITEPDISYDLSGMDARDKLAISASIGFRRFIDPNSVSTFGLRNLWPIDIDAAKRGRMTLRLSMTAQRTDGDSLSAWVEPTLFPTDAIEASAEKGSCLYSCEGNLLGKQVITGTDTGSAPIVAGILISLNDVLDGLFSLRRDQINGSMHIDNGAVRHSYYVRTNTRLGLPARALRTRGGIHYYVTEPISVSHMHALAAAHMMRDPDMFIAGIYE